MNVLGLDVGGATLKLADASGWAAARPFALWQAPQRLAAELQSIAYQPPCDVIALTMTGELCDCFQTKADGVQAVLDGVRQAYPTVPLFVYRVDGRFVDPDEALADPWSVAASNWHALASYVGRFAPAGDGLLIDIGSTTCDLIPLRNGRPAAKGFSDPDRLATGELVYTGVWRTPLFALARRVQFHGQSYGTMAELFATTADVWLTLHQCDENPSDVHTADGRPATRDAARDRLARMIGSDRSRFSSQDAVELAQQFADAQLQLLRDAADQVLSGFHPTAVLLSGQGEFLARQLVQKVAVLNRATQVSLADRLGPITSRAACAHAVAVLFSDGASP
jgi:probable H4MPT-linked C1 transfer pathway protein